MSPRHGSRRAPHRGKAQRRHHRHRQVPHPLAAPLLTPLILAPSLLTFPSHLLSSFFLISHRLLLEHEFSFSTHETYGFSTTTPRQDSEHEASLSHPRLPFRLLLHDHSREESSLHCSLLPHIRRRAQPSRLHISPPSLRRADARHKENSPSPQRVRPR